MIASKSTAECRQIADYLTPFVDQQLSGPDFERVRVHLEGCPICSARVESERRLKQLISQRYVLEPAPPHLRARIRRQLEKEAQAGTVWQRLRALLPMPAIPAYAAALVLLVVGFVIGRLSFDRSGMPLTPVTYRQAEETIHLTGKLVCINCVLLGHVGDSCTCREQHHTVGIQLADGTVWSIIDEKAKEDIHQRFDLINKSVEVEGRAFSQARYIDLVNFKPI